MGRTPVLSNSPNHHYVRRVPVLMTDLERELNRVRGARAGMRTLELLLSEWLEADGTNMDELELQKAVARPFWEWVRSNPTRPSHSACPTLDRPTRPSHYSPTLATLDRPTRPSHSTVPLDRPTRPSHRSRSAAARTLRSSSSPSDSRGSISQTKLSPGRVHRGPSSCP